jgi:hypothetical protein
MNASIACGCLGVIVAALLVAIVHTPKG